MITTKDGSLNIASSGNITFQAGQGGEIMFMGPTGENMVVGEKGEKVRCMFRVWKPAGTVLAVVCVLLLLLLI